MVCFIFIINFYSPHHGKGICDAFGGEYKKVMSTILMKRSCSTFEEYFSICEEAFNCKNSPPGTHRVTFLKFVFIIVFNKLFSYDRTKNFQKKVGNWNLEGISLYYAFTLINGKLFGSKCFSVILEDWVPLYFKETIEEIIVAAVVPEIPPIPGIDISATGPILLNRTVKQIVLPQNGKRGSLKKGMIYIYY